MSTCVIMTSQQKATLWKHLLPEPLGFEQAAFAFSEIIIKGDITEIIVKDIYLAQAADFVEQASDYLELTDEARIKIIKMAHSTGTSILETHSHPFPSKWAASFSMADINGFNEIVPHMWWRLDNRPYAAIVVAPMGFDGLLWDKNPYEPRQIDGIKTNEYLIEATCQTLGVFHDKSRRTF